MDDRDKTVVAIVLVEGFSQLVLTLFTELLRISCLVGPHAFVPVICSLDGTPVRASNGRMTLVDVPLKTVDRVDAVVVCASYHPFDHLDRNLLAWLRRRSRHGATICGVDTGTVALAEAGLLRDRQATVHWEELSVMRSRYPDVRFTSALVERDGRFLTGSGSLGTTDFALAFIAFFAGNETAEKVMDLAVHGRSDHRLSLSNAAVAKAVAVMKDHIAAPIPMEEIAARAGVSPRSLTRLFVREFGQPPVRYYLSLRLERADELVRRTRFPLTDIADATGFASLSWFSRSYKGQYGISPTAARQGAKASLADVSQGEGDASETSVTAVTKNPSPRLSFPRNTS